MENERSLADLVAEEARLKRALKALKSSLAPEGLLIECQLTAQLVKINQAIKEWERKSCEGPMPLM